MKTIAVTLICVAFFTGFATKEKENKAAGEAAAKIEGQRKPFNPNYNVDTAAATLHMTFKVQDGQILPKPVKVELIPGKMPYRPTRGPFLLTYRDSLKKEIVSYSIENPLVIRSCDGLKKPAVSVMQTGVFSIRIPYSPNAAHLELLDSERKEMKRVEVDLLPVYKEYKIR